LFDPAVIPADLRTSRDTLAARIEDAALTASQPSQQSLYDGWLLRYSPGKAKRARSVNAVAAGALPIAEKLAHCHSFYSRHGLPCVFRLTPFSMPTDLDAQLAAAGFTAAEETRVMALDLDRGLEAADGALQDATLRELDAGEFGDVMGGLHGLDAIKRGAERDRFARAPLAGIYLVAVDGGQPIACGSLVVDGELAGIFGMVTLAAHRNRGLATAIVAALLRRARAAGVHSVYLQVEASNESARRAYGKFGFADRYAYWYRYAPAAQETR
jgi:GNAT superfamily N-acetyltransferase